MNSSRASRRLCIAATGLVLVGCIYLLASTGHSVSLLLGATCVAFVAAVWREAWKTRGVPATSDLLLGITFAVSLVFASLAWHVQDLAEHADCDRLGSSQGR